MTAPYYELIFPESINEGQYHYLLYMHDRTTGKRRVYLHHWTWSDEDDKYSNGPHYLAEYYFSDGNGGCDCNRSNWFFTNEEYEAKESIWNMAFPDREFPGIYTCRDEHPEYPEDKIIIEKLVCLETGEVVGVNL